MKNSLKDIKITFLDLSAFLLIVICLFLLVRYSKRIDPDTQKCVIALVGLGSWYLYGSTSGSKKKDDSQLDSNDKLITALKDSTPAVKNPDSVVTEGTKNPDSVVTEGTSENKAIEKKS